MNDEPSTENYFLAEHAQLLISSFYRLTGKELVQSNPLYGDGYQALFDAPYGVVSHNTEADPVFNYGNQTALRVFEMNWVAFTNLPSRKSAEELNRAERTLMLRRVSEQGYIDDYRGVRISSTGKRFVIEKATVWNLIDEAGIYHGQAAVFYEWSNNV